jgi:hypothetical protein
MTQRITMTALQLGEDSRMTKQALFGGAMGLALLFGLSACTDPYDPGQRAIGGGLLGAATGAAIGGAAGGGSGAAIGAAVGGGVGAITGAATTPQRPPPPGYYPPPPGYYGGYPPPYPGY